MATASPVLSSISLTASRLSQVAHKGPGVVSIVTCILFLPSFFFFFPWQPWFVPFQSTRPRGTRAMTLERCRYRYMVPGGDQTAMHARNVTARTGHVIGYHGPLCDPS
ncbi:hypothetical protein LZ32DRAFT_333851 [Colletotrichum eremochloae]|nr:hypothetical protein LZ32DRAFT_333851 [Colletotrichum eremochloae]